MSDDIVNELRFYAAKRKWLKGLDGMPDLLKSGADEIVRLENLLQSIQAAPANALIEIASLRTLLSGAEQREKDARRVAVEDVLSALTAHELYQYRPKAFKGFIDYARSALQSEER